MLNEKFLNFQKHFQNEQLYIFNPTPPRFSGAGMLSIKTK